MKTITDATLERKDRLKPVRSAEKMKLKNLKTRQ